MCNCFRTKMQDASASKPFPIPCEAYHFWSHQVTLGAVRRHSGNSLSKGQLLTIVFCFSLCFVKVGCCLMTHCKSGFLHSTLHVLRSKARLARGGVQSLVGCGCVPPALTMAGWSQCYFLHQDGKSTGRLSRFVFNDSESMLHAAMNWWGFLDWLSAYLSHRNYHHPLESHLPLPHMCMALDDCNHQILQWEVLLSQAFTLVGHWRGGAPFHWQSAIPWSDPDRRWKIWNDYENY